MSERDYNAVRVFGRCAGMNQAAWKGAIDDAETTYSYNITTTVDGEWKKRKGYYLIDTLATTATGETTALHLAHGRGHGPGGCFNMVGVWRRDSCERRRARCQRARKVE